MRKRLERRDRLRRVFAWALILTLLWLPGPTLAEGSFVVEDDEETLSPNVRRQARALMQLMTDEEKVCQLFFVALEDLTGEKRSVSLPSGALARRPVGGVMLFGQNIASEKQLTELTSALQSQAKAAGLFPLFIGVDEEGGAVSRVANKLGYALAPSPAEIGQSGDAEKARAAGECIAAYLLPLGVNTTFAPPADTVIDRTNAGVQTYGESAELVSRMALSMAEGLKSGGVLPCFTHFPGHGEKTGNTSALLSVRRSLEEMRGLEWVPFRDAVAADADMILVSHALVRAAGDDMPASTSHQVIDGILRGELGFDGVVVTDALRKKARNAWLP